MAYFAGEAMHPGVEGCKGLQGRNTGEAGAPVVIPLPERALLFQFLGDLLHVLHRNFGNFSNICWAYGLAL